MSKEQQKHGFFGTFIKVIMIIIFFVIGGFTLGIGIYQLVKDPNSSQKWMYICNIVFGACLLTSPFFLSGKRTGLLWIVKVLMGIIFTVIGIAFIVFGSCALGLNWQAKYNIPQWYSICNIVFGSLLLTSTFFLKK